MLLQLNQAVEDNQLHIVVALLDNQINVALGSSLESIKRLCQRLYLIKNTPTIVSNAVQYQY